jgi:cytochrome c-type biogenesis protein CcmE
MTRRRQRAAIVMGGLALLGGAAGLVFYALDETMVFFHTPSDVAEKAIAAGTRFRLGGLVETGSVRRGEGTVVQFAVTDTEKTLAVAFTGILPDLFREGQGVVAEGRLNESGVFEADSVLAKHDETYMPKEVADALKARGVWQHEEGAAKP